MSDLIVVFDLDDTLYPERRFAISGFKACGEWAEQELGVSGLAEDMTRHLDAGHFGKSFEMALAERLPDYTPDLVTKLIEIYRDHDPVITLHEDAEPVLDHFSGKGPIGLITDGMHEVQARKVKALEIAHHFDKIIYTNALGGRDFHKPHPKAFEIISDTLGGDGVQFAYVGDNPFKDFVAPNAMGWLTVQVMREDGLHDRHNAAEGGEPQHRIDTLHDLITLLD